MLRKMTGATVLILVGVMGRGAAADNAEPADQTRTGPHVAQSKVFFEFNSTELTAAARAELDEAARWIESNETGVILIEGHTDKVGSAAYNKELGERRAEAARSYLAKRGVPAARVRTLSYGEGLPATDTDDRARANRRIVLLAVQKEPIVEKTTERIEVAVPVKQTVYVDRYRVAERDPLGVQVMVGGGLVDALDEQTGDLTDLGGTWAARVAFRNTSLVGFEAAYVGTAQGIDALGLDDNAVLLGNGAEAAIRLNLFRTWRVRPYAFAGLGWAHYDVTNSDVSTSSIEDGDDVLHVPAGVGVSTGLFRGLTLDLRGTMRAAFDDGMFDEMTPNDQMGMETWSTSAQLGFDF